jgi:hypothetical protein
MIRMAQTALNKTQDSDADGEALAARALIDPGTVRDAPISTLVVTPFAAASYSAANCAEPGRP